MNLGIFGTGKKALQTLNIARLSNDTEKKWEKIFLISRNASTVEIDRALVLTLKEALDSYGRKNLQVAIATYNPKEEKYAKIQVFFYRLKKVMVCLPSSYFDNIIEIDYKLKRKCKDPLEYHL